MTQQISDFATDAEGRDISENTAMQMFIVTFANPTLIIHRYVDSTNFVRAHPMASSRRTSPTHVSRQTEWIQPTVEVERTDIARQQKCEETLGESDPSRRRDISEITQNTWNE